MAKLIKDFEPYRVLWSTASDWLRSYDSWMNDPIISVNAEDIEKNVTEMYIFFIITKSLLHFIFILGTKICINP